jgi:hypothetical protein
MYAKFDAEFQTRPRIDFKDFTLDKDEIDAAIQMARLQPGAQPNLQNNKNVMGEKTTYPNPDDVSVPDHVLSVKVLSDFKRNTEMNSTQLNPIPDHLQSVSTHLSQIQGRIVRFQIP